MLNGELNRRDCLRLGPIALSCAHGPTALSAAEGPPARRPRAKACILLYMDGGPSHLDLWDLKPQAPAEIRGPFQPIASRVPGLSVSELLPHCAGQMHRLLQVRSVCHQETVHDPAVYQMLTGYKHLSSAGNLKVEPTDRPQLGTAFGHADAAPASMPKVIELPETMKMEARVLPGQNAGFLGPSRDPFRIELTREPRLIKPQLGLRGDISPARLAGFRALVEQLNDRETRLERSREVSRFDIHRRQALDLLSQPGVQAAFDLETESSATQERYGRNRHGQAVLLARRLVEGGARFVTVYWGQEEQDWADGVRDRVANNPWDTHRNHFPLVKESLTPRADRALAALVADLAERGLLDETLVVWMGDFGRTPRIDKKYASRDHWPHAFTVLLAGAGLPGGAVFGATDAYAAHVTADPVSPADLTATILNLLGTEPSTLIRDPEGKWQPLSTGRPLFA